MDEKAWARMGPPTRQQPSKDHKSHDSTEVPLAGLGR